MDRLDITAISAGRPTRRPSPSSGAQKLFARGSMARKLVLFAVAACAQAAPVAAQESEAATQEGETPIKIGVVNLDAVALQSPTGQALQQELATFQEQFANELQARQNQARAIEVRLGTDSLTAAERRDLERERQDIITNFQRFQQDKQEEASALQADGLAQIQEEIAPVIEEIQTELGYDLVINATSAVVVIFSDRVDITPLIIDRLRASSTGSQDEPLE